MRKIFPVVALAILWLAGGVVVAACAAVPVPLVEPPLAAVPAAVSTVAPATVPTAMSNPAVWVWADSQVVAVDTVTGKQVAATDGTLGDSVQTRDRRVQYSVTWSQTDTASNIYLTALDLLNPAPPKQLLVSTVPLRVPSIFEQLMASLAMSQDGKTIFVALTRPEKGIWRTELVRVDLAKQTASAPVVILEEDGTWGPNVTLAVTPDGREVLVARSVSRRENEVEVYNVRVARVDSETLKVKNEITIPDSVQAQSDWAEIEVAPDGNTFYVLEHIWRDASGYALRVSGFGLQDDKPTVTFLNEANSFKVGCDSRFYFANSHAMWQWCSDFVRFVDPTTGKFGETVALRDASRGSSSFAEYVMTRDGKLVYTVFPVEREVVVMDIGTRQVVQRAQFRDQALVPNFWQMVADVFVPSADAKGLARPVMAMSADETWLALVDLQDYFDGGDGVWIVDTATLKPLGHWLKTEQVTGVRASADGKALYVLNGAAQQMRVLNAATGDVIRTLKLPVVSWGFLGDTSP